MSNNPKSDNINTEIIRQLEQKVTSATILFFDMDGTLIDTDYANYLAYREAVQQIIGQDISPYYTPNERFTRDSLKNIPGLDCQNFNKIIQTKNELYLGNISETRLNSLALFVLEKYSKTNKTALITNCREERAMATLNHHGLADTFTYKFYKQESYAEKEINKYAFALASLKVKPSTALIFENEAAEIDVAILAGIPAENIIQLHGKERDHDY